MKLIKKNRKLHNPDSPLLIGDVKESDVVKEVREPIYIVHKLDYSNIFLVNLIMLQTATYLNS